MEECKRFHSRDWKTLPSWLMSEDFSGMEECKRNSEGGGENVSVSTAGYPILGTTFFLREAKKRNSFVTV
jgi:hypothetical protein